MIIHQGCRYFRGDVPCKFHKERGVHCNRCTYYTPIKYKILIIKLDAIGDVLRATCILQGLKEEYKESHITWLTRKESLPLFKNNDYVDIVIDYSYESMLQIQVEEYDLVINLDSAPKSAILGTMARGKKRIGYGYNKRGFVYPFNKEAEYWYMMGIFDEIKRINNKTFQRIMLEMLGIETDKFEIIFNLGQREKDMAEDFLKRNKIVKDKIIIGMNTGAGKRWKHKKWVLENYLKLIKIIKDKRKDVKIFLYGGIEEIERNNYLINRSGENVYDTGCSNSLREFGALLDLCDILVTGDTLAMHIGIALKKQVIALFGPTSHTEIDLYGRGKKIFGEIECLCCYRPECDVKPTCMELITPDMVFEAVQEMIGMIESAPKALCRNK